MTAHGTQNQGMDGRLQDVRTIYAEFHKFYELFGGLSLVLVGVMIGMFVFRGSADFQTNLYTEFLSICLTVFVLDTRARHREQQRREDDLRDRLLREAASTTNDTAKNAIEELEKRDLLRGEKGWLKQADMGGANLNAVDMETANLQRVNLSRAKLENAMLFEADLQEADLSGAELRNALLSYANLRNAALDNADLRGANLQHTVLDYANLNFSDLRGADLTRASLKNATFSEALFDERSILPDGNAWTPETDLTVFGALISLMRTGVPYLNAH